LALSVSGGALSPVGRPAGRARSAWQAPCWRYGRVSVRAGARAYLGPRPAVRRGRRHDGCWGDPAEDAVRPLDLS